MKCAMCHHRAEVIASWPASDIPQEHAVCESCLSLIWDKLSTEHSGTEQFMCFTITPLGIPT